MGLLSWLFPSDEDRLASVRTLMERGRYEDARKKLVHISSPEAEKLYDECSAKVDAAEQGVMKKRLAAELTNADGAGKEARKWLSQPSAKKEASLAAHRGVALVVEGVLTLEGRPEALRSVVPHLAVSGGKAKAKKGAAPKPKPKPKPGGAGAPA